MAKGIVLSCDVLGLDSLVEQMRKELRPGDRAQIMEDALKIAIRPVKAALKKTTPVGPTSNLAKAIDAKVKQYPLDGRAVGIVGYRQAGASRSTSAAGGRVRAGKDRAFHQWWIEEGTRERVTNTPADKPFLRKSHERKLPSGETTTVREHAVARQGGFIASSYNSLGPFTMVAGTTGGRVVTDPNYPRAFFRKSKDPVVIPPTFAQAPLAKAVEMTQAQVEAAMTQSITASLAAVAERLRGTLP